MRKSKRNPKQSPALTDQDIKSSDAENIKLLGKLAAESKKFAQLLAAYSGQPSPTLFNSIVNFRQLITEIASAGYFQELNNSLKLQIDSAINDLPPQLKEFCETHTFMLSGGFPDYIIEGVVHLAFDVSAYRVYVNDTVIPLFPVHDVYNQLIEEISRITEEAFDPETFLKRLWSAYEMCLKKQINTIATNDKRVSIFALLQELALSLQGRAFSKNPVSRNYRSYSQNEFRSQLYKLLLIQHTPTIHNRRLLLEPTSVAEQGLYTYLPAIGRCAFVGHILFTEYE